MPFEVWGLVLEPELAREILSHKRSLTPHPLEVDGRKLFATLTVNRQGELHYAPAEIARKAKDQESIGTCPVCGGDMVNGSRAYGCSNWRNGCKFVIWKTVARKVITPEIARALLDAGETQLLSGFQSKAGKSFDAKLKIVGSDVKFA